jgi:hypothetical protein
MHTSLCLHIVVSPALCAVATLLVQHCQVLRSQDAVTFQFTSALLSADCVASAARARAHTQNKTRCVMKMLQQHGDKIYSSIYNFISNSAVQNKVHSLLSL